MSRGFILWGVALLLPILHFLLHVGFGLGARAPDLLTVGLLVLARELRVGAAAGVGFAFGLLEDAFSILAFGANAVVLTVIGVLGARSRDLFMGESLVFLASYLALGTWMRFALHGMLAGEEVRGDLSRLLVVEAPLAAVYASGVGVALLLLTGVWGRDPR